MTPYDPKQAILEYLSSSYYKEVLEQLFPEIDNTVNISTLQFLKECRVLHHQVHLVRYEYLSGRKMHEVHLVDQDELGIWHVSSTIGRMKEDKYATTVANNEVSKSMPVIRLSGRLGNDGALSWASGTIINNEFDVARVRLTSSNKVALEDSVQHGYVLFLTDQKIQRPIEVSLYDYSGEIIDERVWLDI